MSFLEVVAEVAVELPSAGQALLYCAHHQQHRVRSHLLVALLERLEIDGVVVAEEVVEDVCDLALHFEACGRCLCFASGGSES